MWYDSSALLTRKRRKEMKKGLKIILAVLLVLVVGTAAVLGFYVS